MDTTHTQVKNPFGSELEGAVYESAIRIVSRKKAGKRWRLVGFLLAFAGVATVSFHLYQAFQQMF
ncbi:MAG: hypothetical protein H6617_10720 [Bdellovibrionaceae bacterium]|nr:hypothetical protein [Bdellovibrionales bacterium]MCB9255144.1 hypothetical protein [Pseudobdellovibrionaceae bacterium]